MMVGLILIVALIVVFDLAAMRWGVDTRPSLGAAPHHSI
jgi:hypothetical protein